MKFHSEPLVSFIFLLHLCFFIFKPGYIRIGAIGIYITGIERAYWIRCLRRYDIIFSNLFTF